MLPAGTCVPSEKTKGVMTFLFRATAHRQETRISKWTEIWPCMLSYLLEEDRVELFLL